MESIRHGGWLSSKSDELNIANAASVTAEDIQNIPHYWKIHGSNADTPILLFIAFHDKDYTNPDDQGIMYFIKATNMPHTKDIFIRKLTPYCLKDFNSSRTAHIDKRGYGAILPFLYYGGSVTIQYNIKEDGSFSQIESDIDEQKIQAKNGTPDDNLKRPSYSDYKGKQQRQRFWLANNIFGDETIQIFKKYKINTLEVFENPSFNNKEKIVKNKKEFQHFIESLCGQFEELLHEGKLNLQGIYLEKNSAINSIISTTFNKDTLYHNLNDENNTLRDIQRPITTSGFYNLDSYFKLEFMYTKSVDNKLLLISQFTKKNGEVLKFLWKHNGGANFKSELYESNDVFVLDFTVIIGKSKNAYDYCNIIKDDKTHPLNADSAEKYANGAYVSINEIRVSQDPIPIPSFPKVANTLDHSNQRIFVDIKSLRAKDENMNLEEWKNRSSFRNNSNSQYDNPIIFAIYAFHSFLKKCFKDQKTNRSEELFLNILNCSQPDNIAEINRPVVKGNSLDARCKRLWVKEFPQMKHIQNDLDIKKELLELEPGTQGGQAADIFSEDNNGLSIVVQIKSGKRCDVTEIRNFKKTFTDIREKQFENGKKCFGILIHYDGIKDKSDCWKLLATDPGIFIISRNLENEKELEDFEKRLFKEVKKLIKYY